MKYFSILLLILSAFSFSAMGKTLELKKNTRSIFIEEKSNWVLGKDLFGMPFIYFSPQVNGQRSNISFTDTGADLNLDIQSLAKSQESYQKGRKDWSEQVGATPISFHPYEVKVNHHGHRVHKIGFTYEHEKKIYSEKSFYIECRGKIIFSKALRLQENSAHDNEFNELLNTLDCGGV